MIRSAQVNEYGFASCVTVFVLVLVLSEQVHDHLDFLVGSVSTNGRPVALMLAVDAGSLDETLTMMRRARAMQALHEVRQEAKAKGLDRLSMTEIDGVIAATRRARREHKSA